MYMGSMEKLLNGSASLKISTTTPINSNVLKPKAIFGGCGDFCKDTPLLKSVIILIKKWSLSLSE